MRSATSSTCVRSRSNVARPVLPAATLEAAGSLRPRYLPGPSPVASSSSRCTSSLCSTGTSRAFGASSGSTRRSKQHGRVACSALPPSDSAFPFNEDEYHRAQFVEEPYGPMKVYKDPRDQTQFTGVMVFRRAQDCGLFKVMEVFVTGDTAINMYSLVNNITLERPMVHDVMFWIVQQAQSSNPRHWGLLRVAIVGLKDDVYIARLFFGDPVTQEVVWDCDCRPSDACFLSIKLNAPLYILRSVWDAASKRLEKSTVHKMVTQQILQSDVSHPPTSPQPAAQQPAVQQPVVQQPQPASPHKQQQPARQPSSVDKAKSHSAAPAPAQPVTLPPDADYTTLLQDDLDAIKLLKRELAVAIREEDYSTAARIRDHPFMRMYREMWMNRLLGHEAAAERVEGELKQLIERNT